MTEHVVELFVYLNVFAFKLFKSNQAQVTSQVLIVTSEIKYIAPKYGLATDGLNRTESLQSLSTVGPS